MVAVVHQQEPEATEQARLEALERMLGVMCDYLTELVEDRLEREALDSREARFQLEAFEERRNRALRFLAEEQPGPLAVKLGNLERLVEALECSWIYFDDLAEAAGIFADSSVWSVCA